MLLQLKIPKWNSLYSDLHCKSAEIISKSLQ